MFFSKDPLRLPESDVVRGQLLALKKWWALGCSTPILYLLIAHGLRVTGVAERVYAFAGLQATPTVLIPFVAAVLAVQAILIVFRLYFDRRMKRAEPGQVFDLYRRRTVLFLVLSDSTAFLGLVLFLLTGRMWAVLALGSVGLLFYAQSYPSECGLVARLRGCGAGGGRDGDGG